MHALLPALLGAVDVATASSALLPLLLCLPLVGALVVLLLPAREEGALKVTALIFMLATAAAMVPLWTGFDPDAHGWQFGFTRPWIAAFGVQFKLGIDGISLLLVLLTGFLGPVLVACGWRSVERRVKEYLFALLMLQAAIIGALVALDLFLFYFFWEAMLIPMYFLIGVWGSRERIRATTKFILFTLSGSLLMLVAILVAYFSARCPGSTGSFDVDLLAAHDFGSRSTQIWLFLAFAVGFAVKVPMVPMHTWLPDAHTEAPTAGSVVLAGILLKLGVYGFLRWAIPLFPLGAHAVLPYIGVLAVVGIVYGALVVLPQRDMKRLVAYSSISHLGFVMLGVASMTAIGLSGALYQSVGHGLSTGGLFLLVGMLYERTHTRLIRDYGGIAKMVPQLTTVFVIVALASMGLPGLNGFVGEFLIMVGSFTSKWYTGPTSGHALHLLGYGVLAVGAVGLVATWWMLAEARRDERLGRGPTWLGAGSALLGFIVLFSGAWPFADLDQGGLLLRLLGDHAAFSANTDFGYGFWVLTIAAATGVILAAAYLLTLVKNVFFGPLGEGPKHHPIADLSAREWLVLVPLLGLIVLMGVYPQPFLRRMEPSVHALEAQFAQTQRAAACLGTTEASVETPPEPQGQETLRRRPGPLHRRGERMQIPAGALEEVQ